MKKAVFVCEKHEDYGSLGWRMGNQIDADPLGGMAVAHDLLEHPPGGDMGPADELVAFGHTIWLRGRGGYWDDRFHNTAAENLSGEVIDIILRHVVEEGVTLHAPPRTLPLDDRVSDGTWAEREVRETVRLAGQHLRTEGYDKEDQVKYRRHFDKLEGWMRIGYREAEERYSRVTSPYRLCCLYKRIEEEADKLLKHANEGQLMTVRWDVKNSTCQLAIEGNEWG
jgi:hypothetical protein